MRRERLALVSGAVIIAVSVLTSGCAVNFYKQSPRSKTQIKELKAKIDDLERRRQEEQEQFAQVKRDLERKLKGQIANDQVSLRMSEGGLVIVLSDQILFDSGKAEIKQQAYSVLDQVSSVIKKDVPSKKIGISGHSDNVPITHSQWKSNWELSSARALNVLHYMEKEGVNPDRLSATGYGEYRPVESNNTDKGRAANRRVEILILPEFVEEKAEDIIK